MSAFDPYIADGDPVLVPDGTCLFRPGDDGRAFLIVQTGAVRVEQTNHEGRTIVLYRVQAGESCVLTTSCLISSKPYAGYGYAEGPVSAVALPAETFRRLFASDAAFRDLVLESFVHRVGELTDVIDALLLHRTDTRLAGWLGKQGPGELDLTQKEIAQEIGTVREVVSRALKSFEREGWLELGRGRVIIRDADALSRYGSV